MNKEFLTIRNKFSIKNEQITEDDKYTYIEGYCQFFNKVNGNGEVYVDGDVFFRFFKEYFIDNDIQMPLIKNHYRDQTIGKIIRMDNLENGLYIKAGILKGLSSYNDTMLLYNEGLLSHFSTDGFATDYEFLDDGSYNIKDVSLLAIALVGLPSEPQAKAVQNTIFSGFKEKKEDDKESELLTAIFK